MPMIPIKLERRDGLVRVVRCRDCVWWEKDRECWYEGSKQYHCYLLEICTDENFYCANGREKEDAER